MNFLLKSTPYKIKGKTVFRIFLPKRVIKAWRLEEEPQLFYAHFDGRNLTITPVEIELEELEQQLRESRDLG